MFNSARIIVIYGASGVGKTSICESILKISNIYFDKIETDFMREIIRGYSHSLHNKISNVSLTSNAEIEALEHLINFGILNSSTKDLTIEGLINQSNVLLYPLIMLCNRFKRLCKFAIIEGVNIPICDIFSNTNYQETFNNVLFVNLYSSDVKMHRSRLDDRSKIRKIDPLSFEEFNRIRRINDFYFEYTKEFIKQQSLPFKIISLDTTPKGMLNEDIDFNTIARKIISEL